VLAGSKSKAKFLGIEEPMQRKRQTPSLSRKRFLAMSLLFARSNSSSGALSIWTGGKSGCQVLGKAWRPVPENPNLGTAGSETVHLAMKPAAFMTPGVEALLRRIHQCEAAQPFRAGV
jgi:hypothetical protein